MLNFPEYGLAAVKKYVNILNDACILLVEYNFFPILGNLSSHRYYLCAFSKKNNNDQNLSNTAVTNQDYRITQVRRNCSVRVAPRFFGPVITLIRGLGGAKNLLGKSQQEI